MNGFNVYFDERIAAVLMIAVGLVLAAPGLLSFQTISMVVGVYLIIRGCKLLGRSTRRF